MLNDMKVAIIYKSSQQYSLVHAARWIGTIHTIATKHSFHLPIRTYPSNNVN